MVQFDVFGKEIEKIEEKTNHKRIRENFKLESKSQIKKELVKYSRSVWNFNEKPRDKKKRLHGATFSLEMAKRIIWIYSEENDLICDPFLGTGTTLEACIHLKRNFIGSELNPEFYKVFLKPFFIQKRLDNFNQIDVKLGDCRDILNYAKPNSIQLLFTSPPYANDIQASIEDRAKRKENLIKNSSIRQYSDSEKDLGNLNYPDFLMEFSKLFEKWYSIIKEEGFAIFLIKDFRDIKNNIPYVSFHSDLANIGIKSGFLLHDLIILDQNEHRKLILNGSKKKFYVNLNNSFLVIFRKPEIKTES